jgi:hypothetical protein
MIIQTPNTSLFPEVDIASKLATDTPNERHYLEDTPRSLAQLLWPLSNANSMEVRRRLSPTRFFVRFSDNEFQDDGNKRVIIKLEDNGMLLNGKGMDEKTTVVERTQYESSEYGSSIYQTDPMAEEIRTTPYTVMTPEMQTGRGYT